MMRLDKFVADTAGMTRSQAARAIRSGTVTVNGVPVRKPEQKIDENHDTVTTEGRPCTYRRFRYFLLDKPTGVITASKDPHQPTVLDLFPPELRRQGIFPVGRLDKDTSGLLLITNDGEFAHRVISPKSGLAKVYRATVEGSLTPEDVERFRNGIVLADGTKCLPAGLEILSEGECLVTVREGKYHQVRRMLAAVGKPVLTLRRLSVGPLSLDPALAPGGYRELSEEDLCTLFKLLHM
ncbi:MAG: rRNA pseudouridine synthase [Oscillospiraceae bacterium]|nr:rRNA pseudouridine synthase [Oscillospiraceae bacterium]